MKLAITLQIIPPVLRETGKGDIIYREIIVDIPNEYFPPEVLAAKDVDCMTTISRITPVIEGNNY